MLFPWKSIVAMCCSARLMPRARSQRRTVVRRARTLIAAIKIWSARVHRTTPVQWWRFFSRRNRYIPHRNHPPATMVIRRGNCAHTHTYILIYDVIRTVSRLIVVTYLRRILYSGANQGCVSLVAGRAADDQHTTVSSVFMMYISAIYTVHGTRIYCCRVQPYHVLRSQTLQYRRYQ